MPRGDGTGPTGMGAMTGRAAGYCAGYPVPGYGNAIGGRGNGFGFGRGGGQGRGGQGYRNRFNATGFTGWERANVGYPMLNRSFVPDKEQEMEALQGQSIYLEKELSGIRNRLQELEGKKTDKDA